MFFVMRQAPTFVSAGTSVAAGPQDTLPAPGDVCAQAQAAGNAQPMMRAAEPIVAVESMVRGARRKRSQLRARDSF